MKYIKYIEIEFTYFDKLRLYKKRAIITRRNENEIYVITRSYHRHELEALIEKAFNISEVNIISYKEVYYKWWEIWIYFKPNLHLIKTYKGRV